MISLFCFYLKLSLFLIIVFMIRVDVQPNLYLLLTEITQKFSLIVKGQVFSNGWLNLFLPYLFGKTSLTTNYYAIKARRSGIITIYNLSQHILSTCRLVWASFLHFILFLLQKICKIDIKRSKVSNIAWESMFEPWGIINQHLMLREARKGQMDLIKAAIVEGKQNGSKGS